MTDVKIYSITSDDLSPPIIGEGFCTDMVRHSDYAAVEQQRDAALKALNDVLENFRANNRKGIGLGPLLRARNVLNQYENYKINPGDKA